MTLRAGSPLSAGLTMEAVLHWAPAKPLRRISMPLRGLLPSLEFGASFGASFGAPLTNGYRK